MKEFKITWKELKKVIFEKPTTITEVQLLNPETKRKFKFIKDKEGKAYDTGEYWEREGEFIIQDVESKKKYSSTYYENGERHDMQIFGESFDFTEIKK